MNYAGWGEPRSDVLCELSFTRFVEHFRLEDLDLPEYRKPLKAFLAEYKFDRPLQLEQGPLVEAEIEASKAVKTTSSRKRKRKLSADGDVSAELQSSKKRTRSSHRTSTPDKAVISTQTTTRPKRLRHDDVVDVELNSMRPRTSSHEVDTSSSKAGAPTAEKARSPRGQKRENTTSVVTKTRGRPGIKAKGSRNNRPSKSAGEAAGIRRSARVASRQTR